MNTSGKKMLGKGAFSRVYDNGDGTVLIKSGDHTKEALSLFINSDRFPKVERLECSGVSTYKMKKYPKVRGVKNSVSEREWRLYKELRKVACASCFDVQNKYDGYSVIYAAIDDLSEEFNQEKEELLDALDELSNYGSDIGFEISPRNIFIENGRILFSDCFFFRTQLEQIRAGK